MHIQSQVTDVDAWAFAAGLFRAIAAIERGLALTADQKEALTHKETEKFDVAGNPVAHQFRPVEPDRRICEQRRV